MQRELIPENIQFVKYLRVEENINMSSGMQDDDVDDMTFD